MLEKIATKVLISLINKLVDWVIRLGKNYLEDKEIDKITKKLSECKTDSCRSDFSDDLDKLT